MGDVQVAYKGERETRVTGDEAQGTMGRRNKRGEAGLARFLPPASLFPQIFIERERDVYIQGTEFTLPNFSEV